MQFKRPINTKSRSGAPVKVNSFQFLRASKLVLSVKANEIINGWELPREVLARAKGDPLTEEELVAWRIWKTKHDRTDLVEANVARFSAAVQSVSEVIADTARALAHKLAIVTSQDAEAIWEAMDELSRELKRAGLDRPQRPRGRPKKIILVEDESIIKYLPNFHPLGTPDYEAYQRILDEDAKRKGKYK